MTSPFAHAQHHDTLQALRRRLFELQNTHPFAGGMEEFATRGAEMNALMNLIDQLENQQHQRPARRLTVVRVLLVLGMCWLVPHVLAMPGLAGVLVLSAVAAVVLGGVGRMVGLAPRLVGRLRLLVLLAPALLYTLTSLAIRTIS